MPALFDAVDIYCERTAPGLLSEPLNFLSNASFFIAAWFLWRAYQKSEKDNGKCALVWLVAIVGMGSALFHSFANQLTQLGDVIPIAIFVFYFLWLTARRLLGLNTIKSLLLLAIFTAAAAGAEAVPDPWRFNGSISYFPCLLAIILIGLWLRARNAAASAGFIKAATWFALSLTFRSVDMAICPTLPEGTHFLWHACNGVVLYVLARVILNQPAFRRS